MNFYKTDNIDIDIDNYKFSNRKIAVIAYIVNDENKILLQQRGPKSRDEKGLYETVGGSVEDYDDNYKSAIIREIQEEMGTEVNIELSNPIGVLHCKKNDINWVFIIFYGKYINGNIKIMEPEKCIGYNFFEYDDAITSPLLSESCKYLIKNIRKHYDY